MKILVTGAYGFIGKNLISVLKSQNKHELFLVGRETNIEDLKMYCSNCDFVFHLAGVNRPENNLEFMECNYKFTLLLLEILKKNSNNCPIVMTSSVQAELNNPYGVSKKLGEDTLIAYSSKTHTNVYIYRLPNIFGKWSRPNYNSVVATFCHNIAREIPIEINDGFKELTLVYIDDLVKSLINHLIAQKSSNTCQYCIVPIQYKVTLDEIAKLIYSFKESRQTLYITDMAEGGFPKKLYSTYLSFLPKEQFSYLLKMNVDERGAFTEIVKTAERGQFSVNVSKPDICKGNHWHHTKNEKFIVVAGNALIQLRMIGTSEIIEYNVSGEKLEIVDIPVGYTHNIINIGKTDLVTLIWCNECFQSDNPDTYFMEVNSEE